MEKMSTLKPLGAVSLDTPDQPRGSEEPRRRSVHFDSKPSTVVHVEHQPSIDSLDDADDEMDPEVDEAEEDPQEKKLNALAVDLNSAKFMRRKSAPVASLVNMDPALAAKYHSVELSGTLKALDPELRKSLTKLKCTNIEDPETDLEVVKNKLVGRDELEIYRQKQMQKASSSKGSSIACDLAMGGKSSAAAAAAQE